MNWFRSSPVGLLIVCSALAACAPQRSAPASERPNLGIADDQLRRASLSLRQVRIRNLGPVAGEGVVSIAVVDSFGAALVDFSLENGVPIQVPAANLGGTEGRIIRVFGSPAFDRLVDSLAGADAPFGLRATIRTVGGDADQSDNVKTREWRHWIRMAPSSELRMKFVFVVPQGTPGAVIRIETPLVPIGARVYPGLGNGRLLPPGRYTDEVRLITPTSLPIASLFLARITLTDPQTGEIRQYERFAAYDTTPPMLSNYRAVLLRDGRLAIQVQAGDRDSGIPENGVSTDYSLDGGVIWHRQVHHFFEDDFGRAAVFETVLGRLPPNALIGIHAEDMVGNRDDEYPVDASLFSAPKNAELLLDSAQTRCADGSLLFAPGSVGCRAAWVNHTDTAFAKLLGHRGTGTLTESERSEVRRLQELRTVLTAFHLWPMDTLGLISKDVATGRAVLRMRGSP